MKKVLVVDYASIVEQLRNGGQAVVGLEDFVGNPPKIRARNVVEFHEVDTSNTIQVIAGQPDPSSLTVRCALMA